MPLAVRATVAKRDERHTVCMTWLVRSAGQSLGLILGSIILRDHLDKRFQEQGFPTGLVQGLFRGHEEHDSGAGMNQQQYETMIQAVATAIREIWTPAAILAGSSLVYALGAKCARIEGETDNESEQETAMHPEGVFRPQEKRSQALNPSSSILLEE